MVVDILKEMFLLKFVFELLFKVEVIENILFC